MKTDYRQLKTVFAGPPLTLAQANVKGFAIFAVFRRLVFAGLPLTFAQPKVNGFAVFSRSTPAFFSRSKAVFSRVSRFFGVFRGQSFRGPRRPPTAGCSSLTADR